MKVPISWLKEYVDLPDEVTPEALAERLTVAGLEVGKINYIGVSQSENRYGMPPSDHLVWDRDKIVLGYIKEITGHPNADRLVLAVVDYGAGKPETVVTGAPNLFEYKDQGELNPPLLTPFALEGAEVIDGHGDGIQRMILKEKELRGIPNRCMVCSEMELGISDAHEGIMLLDYDSWSKYAPGTPMQDVLGDVVLELELTPNLARCFSILGVAREVAALYDVAVNEPDYDNLPETSGPAVDTVVNIEIQEPERNPRFTAGLIRDVEIKDSPGWLKWRLKLVGQRPINNIVDVTNYVMFEIGQPTHAFDYDILKRRSGDDTPTIITRLGTSQEKLTTLDGKQHPYIEDMLMVADEKGVLSFGGVMGGLESEVQEPGSELVPNGTTTVLLEAAAWNLVDIRHTLSQTKLHSEASARFSRGVHPAMALRGLKRGLKLMVEVSGGQLAPGIVDEYPHPADPVVVELPYSEITRILGFEISSDDIDGILRRLQFTVEHKDDSTLLVTVPDHRLDIDTGVIGQADLIEEIARIYGYNNIPNSTMADALPPQRGNPDLVREEQVRDMLAGAGLQEVINYRFTTPKFEAMLTPQGAQSSWPQHPYIELKNPISVERTAMRQTLLAGLLENAEMNLHHSPRLQIFEIGAVYYARNGSLPQEPRRLGILLMGQRDLQSWAAQSDESSVDYYDLKGIVENLLDGLSIEPRLVEYQPTEHNSFHPGRVAEVLIDGHSIGVMGEVHPLVRQSYGLGLDLENPVVAAEFDLDTLLSIMPSRVRVAPVPTQPPAYRDIAVVVPESTTSTQVEDVIWANGGEYLNSVRLFDVYRGKNIGSGNKSMAYALVFQAHDETLSDKYVNKVQKKIISALEDAGASLRS